MLFPTRPTPVSASRSFSAAFAPVAAGCATSAALRRGRDAEHRQDYDLAVVEFTKALRLHPNDTEARLGLERAKLRASQDHFTARSPSRRLR